jgi:uncharacterized membrane protein YkvA (DUF1232 family)
MRLFTVYAIAFLCWLVGPASSGPDLTLAVFVIDDLIVILLVTSILLTITSTTTQAIAAQEAADAQKNALQTKAVSETRAALAEAKQAKRLRLIRLRKMDENIGRSGIRGDVGTPYDAVLDTAAQAERHELNIRLGAEFQADVDRAAASNFGRAGSLGVAGATLSGLADAANTGIAGASAYGAATKPPPKTTPKPPPKGPGGD